MSQQITSSREMESRLRQILLQQRDVVTDIMRFSQEFINQPEHFSVGRLEELMERRAGQVRLIEQLEEERRRLMGDDSELKASLQPFHGEIQEALGALATTDDRLKEMIFNAQLQLTNNMAFTPKFVNLRANAMKDHHASSRVLDITR